MPLPFRLTPDLLLTIPGGEAVQLTADQALQCAADLIRKGTRRLMVEGAFGPEPQPKRATKVRRSSVHVA
jgi:hypothetical protein